MATIAIDSTTEAAQASGTSTARTLAGVVVGAASKLLVVCVHYDNVTQSVIDVFFNGTEELDFLLTSNNIGSLYAGLSVWYIKNPTATTASVVANITSTGYATEIAALVIDDADLTTTFRNSNTAIGTGTATGTLNVSSLTGDLVLDFVTVYAPTTTGMTPAGSQVEKYNRVTTNGEAAGSSLAASGTTTGMAYSWTDSIAFAHAALSIIDVADTGGGGGNLKFFGDPLGDEL